MKRFDEVVFINCFFAATIKTSYMTHIYRTHSQVTKNALNLLPPRKLSVHILKWRKRRLGSNSCSCSLHFQSYRSAKQESHYRQSTSQQPPRGISPPIPKCSGHLKVSHKRLHHARRSHTRRHVKHRAHHLQPEVLCFELQTGVM